MFSSNHIPCSTNAFSPESFFDHEKFNLHFNYPFISEDFTIQNQFSDGSGLQYYYQDQDELLDSVVSANNKKMATSIKDVRTKIYTPRGPRDRRVRLSIDISRKFFCLQDLLGFDKPSKTLDWLFTKSLTAIKDLVKETRSNHCSSSMITDQSRVKFLETIMRVSDEKNGPRKKKKKKTGNLLRYQSRIEARSRARARTKEKLRVKKFGDQETWKIPMGDPAFNDLDLE